VPRLCQQPPRQGSQGDSVNEDHATTQGPAENGTWETGFQAQQMAIDTTGGKAAALNCSTCVDERHRLAPIAVATQRVISSSRSCSTLRTSQG